MQAIVAGLIILFISPLLVFFILLALLIDRHNPIFIQSRAGIDRIPFYVYKIRTMKEGNITFLGKIYRKTGIDEMPQLLNIIKQDMNFVGPRPLTEQDILRLGWDDQTIRWSVRPGITGMAQLQQTCDAQLSLTNDLYYINHRSVLLDVKLIGKSLLVPLIGKSRSKTIINTTTQ